MNCRKWRLFLEPTGEDDDHDSATQTCLEQQVKQLQNENTRLMSEAGEMSDRVGEIDLAFFLGQDSLWDDSSFPRSKIRSR